MYNPVQAKARPAWPLLAICCLGILGLLIATTIVLALIPIYLPSKQATAVTSANDSNTFYLEYSADGDSATSQSGSVTNTADIANALDLGDDADIDEGFVKVTNSRRRRDSSRSKRSAVLGIVFRCKYKFKSACNTDGCKTSIKLKIKEKIQKRGSISGLPCNVLTAGVVKKLSITVKLASFVTTNFASLLLGYGPVSSLTFVAIKNGDLKDPATWLGGIVPFAGCSLVISSGIEVTIPRGELPFPVSKCDVYGKLRCGGGNPSFKFAYPINLAVYSGGSFDDLTSSKRILCPGGSLFTTKPGGSFCSAGTIIQSFSSSGTLNSTTITSPSGPLTCGILPGGGVVSFPRITFIAISGGSLLSGGCFLGGVPPSPDACTDGCGVYIQPGITITTADLDGEININIVQFDVPVGAVFNLGTPGSSKGFKFKFPAVLNVRGSLGFVCSGGGIILPSGGGIKSEIKFFAGGGFAGAVATFIQIVDVVTGINVGSPFDLSITFSGPYFLIIAIDGSITVSVTDPDEESTSTGSTSTAILSTTTANNGTTTANNGTTTANNGTTVASNETTTTNTASTTTNTASTTTNTETTTTNTASTTTNTATTTTNTATTTTNTETTTTNTETTTTNTETTTTNTASTTTNTATTTTNTETTTTNTATTTTNTETTTTAASG